MDSERRSQILKSRKDRSKVHRNQNTDNSRKLVVSSRLKTLSSHLEHVLQQIEFKFYNIRQITCAEKAKMLLKIFFWAVIYLIGSYLTFGPCFDDIKQYCSNTTSTKIINMINNTNMTVPNYTLCFQMNASTFFGFDAIDAIDAIGGSWYHYNTPLLKTNKFYSKAMDEFFNETTEQGVFEINSTGIYSNDVYIIVWMYLSMIYEAEFSPGLQRNPFASINQLGDDFMALKNILLPKIELFNITIDQLKSVFNGRLLRAFYPYVSDSCFLTIVSSDCSNNSVSECASSKNISFIGSNEICFSFSEQKSSIDSCGFINDPNIYTRISTSDVLDTLISVDFAGKGTPPTDLSITRKENNVFQYPYAGGGAIFTIKLVAVTQNLPNINGVVMCSENLTPNDCLNDCISLFISRNCNCVPVILPSLAQKVADKCTFKMYENCLNNSRYEDEDYLICKAACLPSCQTWHYDYDMDQYIPNFGNVEFKFSSFRYVIFQESKESFGDFISALGGALAIWLGLDIIILIQLFWQPVMLVIRRCLAKTTTDDDNNRVIEVNENQLNQTYLKKLKKYLGKHATAHGKGKYFIGIWIFERIFWTVIYATGGVYTAYYCATLCQQYFFGDTYSHASLMFNKSMTLPPATLCISNCDHRTFVDCSLIIELEHHAHIEREGTHLKSYSKLLETQFNDTFFDKTSLLSIATPWSSTLLYIASLYVGILQITESYAMFSDLTFASVHSPDNYTIQWIYHNYFLDGSKHDEIHAMETVLEPKLNQWNVSRDELQQKLGRDWSQKMGMTVNFFGAMSTISLDNSTRLSYLGYQQYCYTLPLDTVSFSNELDHVEISIKRTITVQEFLFPNFGLDFTAHLIAFDFNKIADVVNINGWKSVGDGTFLSIAPSLKLNRTMGVYGHYIQIPQRNGINLCTTDLTQEVCQAECRIQQIEKLCNCSPTTWPMLLNPGSNNCTLMQYKTCLQLNLTEDSACQDKCLPPCEYWTYIFNETGVDGINFDIKDYGYPSLLLNLYVKDYTYIVFQDQFVLTFSSLLASLGGALGICLGLDVRFVIWVIFTPITTILGLILSLILKKNGSLFSPARAEQLKKFAANHWVQQIARVSSFPENSDNAMLLDVFENHAKMTKWLINILLWAIYYVIGLGLTCKMCTDFYLEFRAGPTDFTFNLMQNDSVQLAPSLTICLPLSAKFSINSETEEYNSEYSDVIKKLTEDTDRFLSTSTRWSAHFLLTTLSYLSLYSNYEQLGNAHHQSMEEILSENSSLRDIFDLYDEQLAKANITTDELKQKCGQEARNNFNFILDVQQYSAKNGKFVLETLEINETTYISESRLCYHLSTHAFFSMFDFIEITVNSNILEEYKQPFLNISGTISVDLLGRDFTNVDSETSIMFDSTISVNFGENITSRISIDDFYQAMPVNNGIQKCSDQITLEDCQNEYRIKAIRTACNCTPVSWPALTSLLDGRNCKLEQYTNCLLTADNGTLEACMESCLPFCTHIRYSEQRSYGGAVDQYSAHLLIYAKSLSYRLEQEYLVIGFSDFIGIIGGALGFWIGLDVLMIVHFFYSLCAIVIQGYFLVTKYLGARKRVAVVQQV